MRSEQDVLKLSITVTFVLAGVGVAFGLLAGSASIVFDGIYSLMDASMTVLALVVSRLITSSLAEASRAKLARHFTMGFWHLEPIVLGLSGVMLMGAAVYALVTAVGSLMSGGRVLSFDMAIAYAVVALVAAVGMAIYDIRQNRRIQSSFLALDAKAWMISAALTAALLAAFVFGLAIQGTRLEWLSPYVDPAALAIVCIAVLPMPVPTVRQALADILLVTPSALKSQVDDIAAQVVGDYGFMGYRAYVARVGRGRQIELYFIVPTGQPARPLEDWDRIRDHIGAMIGDEGPDRWLTIAFTTDIEWAE